MKRASLRHKVWVAHSHWPSEHRRKVVLCPWCEKVIQGGFDAHEYLVKRSVVPRAKQDLIFVPENVIPLHHECHMAHGQTRTMKVRCLRQAMRHIGAERIARWYLSLWQEHGVPVPRGSVDLLPDWEAYLLSAVGARGCGDEENE